MSSIRTITPCLWFDDQAEEAAKFYTGIFKSSKIIQITHYSKAGQEIHKRPTGSVMTVVFELEGHRFTALNGGPHFKFNEAISFEIHCETQGGDRPFLGEALRRRRPQGPAVRLAQGPLRRLLASRPRRDGPDVR